jgi:hypothetical protein
MYTMRNRYYLSGNVIRERYPPLEGAGGGKIKKSSLKVIIKLIITMQE